MQRPQDPGRGLRMLVLRWEGLMADSRLDWPIRPETRYNLCGFSNHNPILSRNLARRSLIIGHANGLKFQGPDSPDSPYRIGSL